MSRGCRLSDISLPYPLSGILRFCLSAMWSCFYTTDRIKSSEWTCYDVCSLMTRSIEYCVSKSIEYSSQYSLVCIPLKVTYLQYNHKCYILSSIDTTSQRAAVPSVQTFFIPLIGSCLSDLAHHHYSSLITLRYGVFQVQLEGFL